MMLEEAELHAHQFPCEGQEDRRQTSELLLVSLADPSDKGFPRSIS